MNKERLTERINEFRIAFGRLQEALAQPEDEYMRDAIIQRFEFIYELAWKPMKLWLATKDIDVRNPKDTLTEALPQGLIQDGNGWSIMHEMRNLTSHTYDEKYARQVVGFLRSEGTKLLAVLTARLAELAARP